MSARQRVLVALCALILWELESVRAGQAVLRTAGDANAKIWVGRQQEIEEYLKTAECLTLERLGSATYAARCVLRPGGPVARMHWMPLPPGIYRGFFTSYKTGIAAYELDKLLRMEMVPPSVERQVQGVTGAATLWVENVDTWKGEVPPAGASRAAWDTQVARMTMFDSLIGNRERNQANILRDGAWNLILLDHTRAFGLTTELSPQLSRIEKDFWDRLLGLTRKELDVALRPWLDENQIAAMLDRRERMKAAIERLVAEKGEAAVVLR